LTARSAVKVTDHCSFYMLCVFINTSLSSSHLEKYLILVISTTSLEHNFSSLAVTSLFWRRVKNQKSANFHKWP